MISRFTIFHYAFSLVGHAVYYIMLFNLHKYLYKYFPHQQYSEIMKIYVGQIDTPFVANLFRITLIKDTFLAAFLKLRKSIS